MEVGCPQTWRTGTADPKPKPEHPRAHPTCNPATSPAHQKNPAPAPITLNWKNSGKLTE